MGALRKYLAALALVILLPALAWSANYYITPTGSGTTCSAETPCALSYAITQATTGETIFFDRQGTWTSSSTTAPFLDCVAGVTYDGTTYNSGGSQERALLQAVASFDGDTWNAFIKVNASNVTFKNFEVDVNKQTAIGISIGHHSDPAISTITVDNCLVHGAGNGESEVQLYTYGILIGSPGDTDIVNTDINITNTKVYDNYHEGIAVYPSWGTITNCGNGLNRILIRGCEVYNNGTDSHPYGSGLGIAINNNSDNVTLEYNTIYDNGLGDGPGQTSGINIRTSGCGSDTTHPNGAPNDLIIRYNLIYGIPGHGIINRECWQQTQTVKIYGNIIYNNTGYGFAFNSQDFGNSTYELYNNTFYTHYDGSSNGVGCIGLSRDSSTVSGTPTVTLKNNILYFDTNSTLAYDNLPAYLDYGSGTLVHEYNLYYRTTGPTYTYVSVGNWGSHTYYDGEGANAVTATWESTAKITNPLFVGGTLPTGFTGTYGTDMIPNSNYFNVGFGAGGPAYDNGTTLVGYEGAINGAGLAVPVTRPQGAAYDIGAYEYYEVAVYSIPGAPTIGTATAGYKSASVAFTEGDDGNSTITSYTATSSPGSITGTAASSPITVSGLTNFIAYTFSVTATNAIGTGPASAASNSVTPIEPVNVTGNLGGNLK